MKALKPIRNEADYDAAFAKIEHIWGARAGTPEGDRLDILATLVKAYENEHIQWTRRIRSKRLSFALSNRD